MAGPKGKGFGIVGPCGLEPATPCLQIQKANLDDVEDNAED